MWQAACCIFEGHRSAVALARMGPSQPADSAAEASGVPQQASAAQAAEGAQEKAGEGEVASENQAPGGGEPVTTNGGSASGAGAARNSDSPTRMHPSPPSTPSPPPQPPNPAWGSALGKGGALRMGSPRQCSPAIDWSRCLLRYDTPKEQCCAQGQVPPFSATFRLLRGFTQGLRPSLHHSPQSLIAGPHFPLLHRAH
jgi:hypothetical protein